MGPAPYTDDRIDLPADFADHLATVSGLESPPETMAEYWAGFADQLAASDRTIEPEDLYTEDPTRHEVRVNDSVRYTPCVLDALGAAVLEPQDPVDVRSVDPVTRTPVTFTVEDGTVDVSPEEAIVTFGIAPSVPAVETGDETIFSWMLRADAPSLREAFCRYINAFESAATYDRWVAETDGQTVPIQPAAIPGLIRRYVDLD